MNHNIMADDVLATRTLTKKMALRRKLLSLLPRTALEEMSQLESPWHVNRPDLIERVMASWDHDDVSERIAKLLEKAK